MKPLQATSVQAHPNWSSFVGVAAPGDTAPIVKVKPVGVDKKNVRTKLLLTEYLSGRVVDGLDGERGGSEIIFWDKQFRLAKAGVCVGGAVGGRASKNHERFIGTPSAERVLSRGVWGT